jgi:hypothetical protein
MHCPNSKIIGASGVAFCPSTYPLNEHHTEWSSEYYCTTCGYEKHEKFEVLREVKREIPPPSPPRRKKKVITETY